MEALCKPTQLFLVYIRESSESCLLLFQNSRNGEKRERGRERFQACEEEEERNSNSSSGSFFSPHLFFFLVELESLGEN